MGRGRGLGRGLGARRGGRREMVGGQMVIDHDDDNLSDKEVYSKNIPAIGEYFSYITQLHIGALKSLLQYKTLRTLEHLLN